MKRTQLYSEIKLTISAIRSLSDTYQAEIYIVAEATIKEMQIDMITISICEIYVKEVLWPPNLCLGISAYSHWDAVLIGASIPKTQDRI